jgi:hypothetical protein
MPSAAVLGNSDMIVRTLLLGQQRPYAHVVSRVPPGGRQTGRRLTRLGGSDDSGWAACAAGG